MTGITKIRQGMPPLPAEVRLQHDAGKLVGRGRVPKYDVAIIPHATSCPAVCVSDGHYQNSSEHATFAHVVRMM